MPGVRISQAKVDYATTSIARANELAGELASLKQAGKAPSRLLQARVRTTLARYKTVQKYAQDPSFARGSGRAVLKNALKYLTSLYALAEVTQIDKLPIELKTRMRPDEIRNLIAREVLG